MAEPRVPGSRDTELELPCGETVDPIVEIDMGMREFDCACGATHAVVVDVHPPSRFVPEDVVATLREVTDTADASEMGELGTAHLMGMVMEEFPDRVVSEDVSEDGSAGYALVWVADMPARELHQVVVELIVEMMDHAIGHAEDDGDSASASEFQEYLDSFDVSEFVDAYRAQRDFEDEHDRPV